MEKIRTALPQKDNEKEIRSLIVQQLHEFEQTLNNTVLMLRQKINTELKNEGTSSFVTLERAKLYAHEDNLTLFREIFSPYLPPAKEKEKPKRSEREKARARKREKEYKKGFGWNF